MSSSIVLILVPGLTSEAVHDLIFDCRDCAFGSLAPLPLDLDPEAVLLGGAVDSGEGADIRKVLATYGLATEELDFATGREEGRYDAAIEGVRAALALGTGLVIVRPGLSDRWVEIASTFDAANVLIVGHSTGMKRSGFVARGPDIVAAEIEGRPVDLQPSLLGHFEVLPPPGPEPEGRLLHEIFRWARPEAEEEMNDSISSAGAGSATGRVLE